VVYQLLIDIFATNFMVWQNG